MDCSYLEVTGQWCQEMLCPYASSVEFILAKRCVCTHGRILRYTKYGLWTRQVKVIGQRNPEETPHKSNSNYHEGATLSEPTCVPVHYMYVFFLLINPLLVLLISIFVGIFFLQSQQTRALSLTTGLVARIWFSHCHHLISVSGWEWKPPSSHCRLRPPEVITITPNKIQNRGPFKSAIYAKMSIVPCVRPLSWPSPCHSSSPPTLPLSLLAALHRLWHLLAPCLSFQNFPPVLSPWLSWMVSVSWSFGPFLQCRTWLFSARLRKICCRPKLSLPLAPAAGPSPPGFLPLRLGRTELVRLVIRRDNQVIWS